MSLAVANYSTFVHLIRITGLVSKETVVLRRWGVVTNTCLVLPRELIR